MIKHRRGSCWGLMSMFLLYGMCCIMMIDGSFTEYIPMFLWDVLDGDWREFYEIHIYVLPMWCVGRWWLMGVLKNTYLCSSYAWNVWYVFFLYGMCGLCSSVLDGDWWEFYRIHIDIIPMGCVGWWLMRVLRNTYRCSSYMGCVGWWWLMGVLQNTC